MVTLTGEYQADLVQVDKSSDHMYSQVHIWNYPDWAMTHLQLSFGNNAKTVGTLNASLANWFQLYAPVVVPDKIEHRVWGNCSPNLVGGVDFYFHD